MKRRILVATIGVGLAVLLGFGSPLGPRQAHADPAAVVLLNPGICLAAAGAATPPLGCVFSNGLEYTNVLGVGDVNLRTLDQDLTLLTPSEHPDMKAADFAKIQLTGNQIHQLDGTDPSTLSEFAVLAFVNADAPVTFQTDAGFFLESGGPIYTCNAGEFVPGQANQDPDCGGGSLGVTGPNALLNNEDHVVVAYLRCTADTCTRGPHFINVVQQGIIFPQQFTVVGEPVDIKFFTPKTVIQAGVPNKAGTNLPDCPLEASVAGFTAALGEAEKTVVVARAVDSDGTAIAGAWIIWSTNGSTDAVIAQPGTPTLDLGGFGFGAPNILCAVQGASAGHVTVTARLTRVFSGQHMDPRADPDNQPANINAFLRQQQTTFDVHAAPTKVSLSADPPSLVCDGTATTTVSALVTDSVGIPAAAGTTVGFDTLALGNANPLIATTNADGVATSVISPLAGDVSGIPVNVIVAPTGATASILIACQAAAAPAPAGGSAGAGAAPEGAATGQIRPPNTGMGMAQDTAFPVWPVVAALAVASLGLLLAAGALRRVRI